MVTRSYTPRARVACDSAGVTKTYEALFHSRLGTTAGALDDDRAPDTGHRLAGADGAGFVQICPHDMTPALSLSQPGANQGSRQGTPGYGFCWPDRVGSHCKQDSEIQPMADWGQVVAGGNGQTAW